MHQQLLFKWQPSQQLKKKWCKDQSWCTAHTHTHSHARTNSQKCADKHNTLTRTYILTYTKVCRQAQSHKALSQIHTHTLFMFLIHCYLHVGEKKPVIASMADVAASGGYYMAMVRPSMLHTHTHTYTHMHTHIHYHTNTSIHTQAHLFAQLEIMQRAFFAASVALFFSSHKPVSMSLTWAGSCNLLYICVDAFDLSSKKPEVVDGAKVLKMFLFWCKSCLINITKCFMKFEAKWTTPVVWAEIQFKFWHWMFTYWATTLYPGPLFTSKHDRSTSFMIRNRVTCGKPDLVELGFPPFLAPLLQIFKGSGP